jgi:hypothetical protein
MPVKIRRVQAAARYPRELCVRYACFALLAAATSAQGQFIQIVHHRPTVPVTIHHPPTAGVTLDGKKVAFGPMPSGCPQQFADSLMQEFVRRGVTVVNRAELDTILAEHHFQLSAAVDPSTAVALGKILGPSLMVFITVSRCDAVKREPLRQDQAIGAPMNISRTEAHFLASVHVVDLATGRELIVQTAKADPHRDNTSQTGMPEYPGEYELQDVAVKAAIAQTQRLFFPWSETREVSFMNGKECNLRQAYDVLRTGDAAEVLKISQANVDLCKSDPKPAHQSDAWYNLGVSYLLVNDYDQALTALMQAERLHGDPAIVETISETRRAKAAAEASAKHEDTAASDRAADAAKERAREAATTKAMLTNDYIVKLVKGGLPADIIVKTIAAQPAKFSLLPDDLIMLKQSGVPDSVIAAMLDKR